MTTVVDLRAELALRTDCQFVCADEFVSRLTSHSAYERCDEPAANLLGLMNPETGRRFLVGAEEVSRRPFAARPVSAGA
ncbi:MAG: hypothetical protein KDA90_03535 [Planctomycetaceae bacterium]|nr:hypothetical protein [Planctomycetaceae bacterium]